jgi:hypothetical protein
MEGKGETILNSVNGNSGIIPTGNPLAEVFKTLGGAIQKAEQKEKELADKEKIKLERNMNKQPSKSKDRGWDMER